MHRSVSVQDILSKASVICPGSIIYRHLQLLKRKSSLPRPCISLSLKGSTVDTQATLFVCLIFARLKSIACNDFYSTISTVCRISALLKPCRRADYDEDPICHPYDWNHEYHVTTSSSDWKLPWPSSMDEYESVSALQTGPPDSLATPPAFPHTPLSSTRDMQCIFYAVHSRTVLLFRYK